MYPERIQSVAVFGNDGADSAASAQLGTSTYCLQVTPSMSPALIVPKVDLISKKEVFGPLTRLLAGPSRADRGTLSSMETLKDVASLYGGKDGRIIRHEPQAAVASQTASATAVPEIENLPSYAILGFGNDSARSYAIFSKIRLSCHAWAPCLPSLQSPGRNVRGPAPALNNA